MNPSPWVLARPPSAPGTASVFLLALMMMLAAGMGSVTQELLQDTLKSMIVAVASLVAGLAFYWQTRKQSHEWLWHDALALPLSLAVYAAISVLWSHSYLAAAEMLRWTVLTGLMWLGLQVFTPARVPLLLSGIHLGAVLASLWAALQFWFDFGLFPQGPNPASTFVNRNFFAEFVVTTLPFSMLLLAQATTRRQILVLAFSNAWCVLALLMTGTRSATMALMVLAVVLPVLLWRCRQPLAFLHWNREQRLMVFTVFFCTLIGLGQVGSRNPAINADHDPKQHVSALERSFQRTARVASPAEYTQGSFSMRIRMWQATARMILAHPLGGVGAGAWEVEVPLFQQAGAPLETDYYAHNEFLQLLAEYGGVGWVFLLGLLLYLALAGWRTVQASTAAARAHAPLRAMALASLLAMLVVSSAGFPWRLASTGAMLALSLGLLFASDAILGTPGWFKVRRATLGTWFSNTGMIASLLALSLTVWISYQAVRCERAIVRAVATALTLSGSGVSPNAPTSLAARTQILEWLREGVAINPHYRKITPMAADLLAQWGDWQNAVWIWESVASSRPHVAALQANIARAYLQLNQLDKASAAFERALALQPEAATVRTLEMVYRARLGQDAVANRLARRLFAERLMDLDVVRAAYTLGLKQHDWELAILATTALRDNWPDYAMDSWLKQAAVYQQQAAPDSQALMLHAYRQAVAAVPEPFKDHALQRIPAEFRQQL